MIHKNRTFGVAVVEDAATLAEKLQAYTWTACTAFRSGKYVFANDSFSEDGAQEYAVLLDNGDGTLREVESITFGWCDPATALRYVTETLAGKYDTANYGTIPADRFPAVHGTCGACA